jgi:hypothetical protein
MDGVSYEILDQKVANKGLMGDLDRSWIIKLDRQYNEENFLWKSWPQSSAGMEFSELNQLLLSRHRSFKSSIEKDGIIQRDIPQGVLDTMRHATVRVCVIGEAKNHLFVIFESD